MRLGRQVWLGQLVTAERLVRLAHWVAQRDLEEILVPLELQARQAQLAQLGQWARPEHREHLALGVRLVRKVTLVRLALGVRLVRKAIPVRRVQLVDPSDISRTNFVLNI